ncbi:MAG TPA: hypothetical protein VFW07_12880 [Parafilimonas sp.]|nr:hypothetical protein [Parafilimonas sp.]
MLLKESHRGKNKITSISFPGIKGKIFDNDNGVPLPARIVIRDANDSVYNSYYKALPGFFTEEDGSFLYLYYPPHLALIEELATGNWLKKYDSAKYSPGEVPWEEFHFDKTKQILSRVDWTIEMSPNERDALWEKFESMFTPSP